MPALIAFPTGVVNEVELVSVVAIPAALADTAELIADTISDATEFAEPVHFGVGRPNSVAASAMPYWVGTKKLFVVTWLTNQNWNFGVPGNGLLPVAAAAALDDDELLDELQAARSADAAAVALTRPVPASSFRRVGPSFISSFSIASSTFGA